MYVYVYYICINIYIYISPIKKKNVLLCVHISREQILRYGNAWSKGRCKCIFDRYYQIPSVGVIKISSPQHWKKVVFYTMGDTINQISEFIPT